MIIFVDIECIDYSSTFDCQVSNRACESRFLYYAQVRWIRPQQMQSII